MWFVEKNFEKVKNGQRALERELVRSARSLSDNVSLDATFAAEMMRQVIHRLMLTMIEIGLVSMVRQLMPARPPARIYALPVP
jgi:c-di-GMP-related signal transduction protein